MYGSARKMMQVLSVAAVLVMVLSGCGGGGGGGGAPAQRPEVLNLPPGHGLVAGKITVPAGQSVERGNVVVACVGDAACVVTVMADGTAVYEREGGAPTVTPRYEAWSPMGHGLTIPEITVPAGVSREHGNMVVTCPAGGSACVVRVLADGTAAYAATGGVPTFTFVHPNHEQDNPTAEDLLDHWNEPGRLRGALGLGPVDASEVADRARRLTDLINMAGGDPVEAGTSLRNVRPEDIEIIGERDGITYGRWTGGPAGTLNIEFDWRFAPNFDAATRARMERAGKSWSWRLLDDFGTHVARRGSELGFVDAEQREVLSEDVTADDVLIFIFDEGDSETSSAGPQAVTMIRDDHQPWLGLVQLSQRHTDYTVVMAHEVGHVIGVSRTEVQPLTRYINRTDHTFEGPQAMRANGGQPVPFQWVDANGRWVEPNTPGAEVDYGHFAVCTSIMAYCSDPREVYVPSELDFAYLDDVGYDILPAATAAEPELYGYGAWGEFSAWGAGVERTIELEGGLEDGLIVEATDTLRAAADAFGMAPGMSLAEMHGSLQGGITWSGSLIGVDLGQPMLPPVFGNAELRVELSTLQGTASFDALTVHDGGVSSPFRDPDLAYAIGVTGNAFSDADGRVLGGFYGPGHEEMAGVVNDRRATVNLIGGFGGRQ
ncbi:MAG: hypothetical protein OXU75_08015 [Deltaproteobacteria bacterium]|nr:hypothetical protein [Deltaproteobacteria bacterium]